MSRIVIIGGVAGGMSAAARLRRMDENAEIVVLEKGEYVSYANCGLPYYVGGAIQEREKLLVQTVKGFGKRFRADVRTKNEALSIDRANKTVKVRKGDGEEYSLPYDKLILSPGAEPIRPPLPGIDLDGIFTLRSIPDTDKIKAYIDSHGPHRALIVGAGYIGMEMAENLHERGIFVTMVELAPQVLSTIDPEMAAIVHQHLKTKRIEFYLGDAVCAFEDAAGRVKTKLRSGKDIISDMVVLAIGVKADVHLAKEAGLEIGERGGISVNPYMQTSDPDIYAVGDAVEVVHGVTGKKAVIPLAGPANKQGRIVADNIALGNKRKYEGTFGTAIAKVFDLTVGVTGATERLLRAENIPFEAAIVHPSSHATYYPNALQLSLKVLFSPRDGKILGAQCVGFDGVDKRIDIIATLMHKGGTVYDLTEIEHAYAPPYSSAKDPVNMAGFVAENILTGKQKPAYWYDIEKADRSKVTILDVRTAEEVHAGAIEGHLHIPVDNLRDRLSEIPKDKPVIAYCRVGLRGFVATRILEQSGFKDVRNLIGGYLTYSAAVSKQDNPDSFDERYEYGLQPNANTNGKINLTVNQPKKVIPVDATGLQCPGPIMLVKNEIDRVNSGDRLDVKASDPGFYNDIIAWAKATGNSVASLNMEKGIVNAIVEKGDGKREVPVAQGANDKTMIVFDNDLDKVIASFIIANGAISMGRKVTMFFTFWGLTVLRKSKKVKGLKKNIIEKMFSFMLPKGTRKLKLSQMHMAGMGTAMIRGLMISKKVGTIEDMVLMAIRNGARLVACQMSMDLMGIKKEELIDGVEIGGVATYLEAAEHADNNLFI